MVYVLRSYPEVSETFIVREIRGLVGIGVPVTILAHRRPLSYSADAPEATYLGGPFRAAAAGKGARNTGAWAREAASDLVRLTPRPRAWARALRLALLARRGAEVLPADTVRLHAHFANDAGALARYLGALSGLPYRVTAHAYDLFQDPFLLGANLARAETIYTVSKANEAWLLLHAGRGGWDPDRVRVLRCGLDLDRFIYRDPPAPRRPARIVCPARLVAKKGHGVLFDAVARLAADGLECDVVLAGDGPLADGLHERAARPDLAGRVTFLGAVPQDTVRARMLDADLVVLASRIAEDGDRDGLPVALIEAMALGVPVVSTEIAGIPELVSADTGWLVPPDRPDALAAAIRSALDEPLASRVERCRRARLRVEAEYDVRLQVDELAPRG